MKRLQSNISICMKTEVSCLCKMFVVLVIIAVGIVTIYFVRKRNKNRKTQILQGPKGLPLVGCIFEFDEATMANQLSEYVKKFGDLFQFKILADTVLVLNSAEMVKKAFTSEDYKRYMNDRPKIFYGEYFRSNGQTAGFSSGEIHRVLKKCYIQGLNTFGSGKLELERNVMTEMENLVSKLDNLSGQAFCLVSLIQRSLSNVISLVLSGETISDDDPDVNMFWEHVHAQEFFLSSYHNFVLSNLPIVRLLPGTYGRLYRLVKRIDRKIADRYWYKQKATYVPGKVRGLADYYMYTQKKHNESNQEFILEDHHVISQFADTVDAGITTSSSALSNSFVILMNYPEIQKKIQTELDRVIGRDRNPTFADRERCVYLKAFEMETHRYIPVAPLSLPHKCNQDVEFEGFDVKANTTILVNVWHIHHDEKVWGDPWNFRPERFLDENGDLLPKEHKLLQSLIPFGAGPRICPGQMFARTRYFLYLASMLQRWTFEFPPNESVSCDPRNTDIFETSLIIRVRSLRCVAKKRT